MLICQALRRLLVNFSFNYHIVEEGIFVQGVSTVGIILLADADLQTSGSKAASCGRLASLAAVSSKGSKLVTKTTSFLSRKFTHAAFEFCHLV